MYKFLKRLFDVTFAFIAAFLLSLPIAFVAVCIRLTSAGPVIYWSERVGYKNQIFRMPKFRTMHMNTPTLATHLL